MLNDRQARFVEEYLIDLNATQAAIRAGYSASTAYSQGQRLLKNVEVAQLIDEGKAARSERVQVTQDDVLRELWAIGSADPNELIEYRRGCCRFCWGKDHRYQETASEREERRVQYEKDKAACGDKPTLLVLLGKWDTKGGVGYQARRDPNPKCPECWGEGIGSVVAKDTRHLTGAAKKLYAGVKVTAQGLEIKTHDKVGALQLIGRHLGMFIDKSEVEVKDERDYDEVAAAARLAAILEKAEARRRAAEGSE